MVESDIGSLVVGQTATVSIDAVEQDVQGVVTSVVPTTSGSTSSVVSYPVTVTLTDPDASVLSGMSSDVEIVIEQAAGVVAVPVTALDGRNGSYTVQVVTDDGSTETRAVTVGLVTETTAEIESGLAVGEEVVVGTITDRTASEGDSSESAFDIGALSGGGGGERPAGPPRAQEIVMTYQFPNQLPSQPLPPGWRRSWRQRRSRPRRAARSSTSVVSPGCMTPVASRSAPSPASTSAWTKVSSWPSSDLRAPASPRS